MPWCPKCKIEYKQGLEICSDCGSTLLEELPKDIDEVVIANLDSKELAQRFIDFLNAEKIIAHFIYSVENEYFQVKVHEKDSKKAKKYFAAFSQVELDLQKKEQEYAESEDEENIIEQKEQSTQPFTAPSTAYVKKSEKSKDLKSTASTFLIFGILGLLFVGLNIAGIITFFDNVFSYIVMIVMFTAFIFIGLSSFKMAKKADADAVLEEELTKKINDWLSISITESVLNSFEDSKQSAEINFMRKMDGMKEMVLKEFGTIDDSYLDSIIEEFYNSKFENEI